jgi:Protein of unknown function (DUF4089)
MLLRPKVNALDTDFITRHVESTAALIGLPIADEYRAGVERYFGIAASLAALVMAMPLTAADEPAEVFVPVSPEAG